MARVAPTNRPQNRKRLMMWFLSALWFLPSLCFLSALWFFAEFVVFVGFVVFVELVDLRSTVVINGKPQRDLTPQSKSC